MNDWDEPTEKEIQDSWKDLSLMVDVALIGLFIILACIAGLFYFVVYLLNDII